MSDQDNTTDESTDNTTDESTDDTTNEKPTFTIGDFNSFFIQTLKFIFHVIIMICIGNHILYVFRNDYEKFVNENFPTDKTKSPFCSTPDVCEKSFFYMNTKVKEQPYEPKFMIDCIKDQEGKYDKNCYDEEYIKWITYWTNNTFMMTNIYNNYVYKLMYDAIHRHRNDSMIVFFGWFILLFITLLMVIITHGTFIMGIFTAYNNYSWVLAIGPIGSIIFGFMHLFKKNLGNSIMSFCSIIPACIWSFFIFIFYIIAIILPHIKIFRMHIFHGIATAFMLLYKLLIWLFGWIIGFESSESIYDPIISQLSEFSKGIMIIISFIVLYFSYQYLTKGITIGMAICCFYLFYIHRHSKKN